MLCQFVISTIFETATETRSQYQSLKVLHAVPYPLSQSGIILNFYHLIVNSFLLLLYLKLRGKTLKHLKLLSSLILMYCLSYPNIIKCVCVHRQNLPLSGWLAITKHIATGYKVSGHFYIKMKGIYQVIYTQTGNSFFGSDTRQNVHI